MNLKIQFEVVLICLLSGYLFMIVFEFINRMLYKQKGKISRFVIELIVFISYTFAFFLVMLKTNNNDLNIYIPLFLLLGAILYIYTLQPTLQYSNEIFFSKIVKKRLYLKEKFDIIKMKKKSKKASKNETNQKPKKSVGKPKQT